MKLLTKRWPAAKWTAATWAVAGPLNPATLLVYRGMATDDRSALGDPLLVTLCMGPIPAGIAVAGILLSLGSGPVMSSRVFGQVFSWGWVVGASFPIVFLLATGSPAQLLSFEGAADFARLVLVSIGFSATWGLVVWLPPTIVAAVVVRFMLYR